MPRRAPARASRAPRAARRVRLDTDERRAQLLQLGMKAFSERTYDEVSIDDLARAAGVSKGLLYHYFSTKRDFYVAGLRETARELLARTLERSHAGLTPLERVRRGLDAYLDHVGEHARAFVALMRGGIGSDPEVAAVIEDVRTAYVTRFLSDMAVTPLAATATDPLFRIAVRGWLGFIEAASIDWLSRPEVERARVRDLILEMLVAMLRAAGAPVPAP